VGINYKFHYGVTPKVIVIIAINAACKIIRTVYLSRLGVGENTPEVIAHEDIALIIFAEDVFKQGITKNNHQNLPDSIGLLVKCSKHCKLVSSTKNSPPDKTPESLEIGHTGCPALLRLFSRYQK